MNENIRKRAAAIAGAVKSIRIGSVNAAVSELEKAIVALVEEATAGAPKPVLPPHDSEMEQEHEETGYGIFCTESDSGPLLVLFGHNAKERAEKEILRRQALDEDDDDRLSADYCVCRCLCSMLIWNSIDPDPRVSVEP